MTVVPLHQPRWDPDEHLIDAAIAGRVRGTDLPTTDRAWLVAHLTHRGHTTDTIAAWLHCSRRTVQMSRTEPVAVLTTRLLAAQAAVDKALSQARASRITPAAIDRLISENQRLRDSRGELIDQLAKARQLADIPCPPSVIVVHPARTRRRPPVAVPTLPLF
ncbi:hypothetical protein [Nocardia cerradoensis]|uniref:Uncharacterized protein n=1 Tax=Nocardia cerradoensis TaxID=85688 RepID=A0A231GTL2_9NOCA|nr:hypothetical protein [Nocardia cerradoensis]NKY47974.1 hypothetical protein [Nocardia cerradoensis]OXR39821.1 hypothetical protein B7C42_08109 [Nocardia cerradoensis]